MSGNPTRPDPESRPYPADRDPSSPGRMDSAPGDLNAGTVGTATPGTAYPDTATPGTATPGTATPGTATPGTGNPDAQAPTAGEPALGGDEVWDPAATPARPPLRINRTRTGGLWVAVTTAAVVLLLLLIFIMQNSRQVEVTFFGADGHLSLGVAMLLSAVLGALLVALLGSARILQLRHVARRHRKQDAKQDAAPVTANSHRMS